MHLGRVFTERKEQVAMIFYCLVLLMGMIVLGIGVQRRLFKASDGILDPEWELFEQRYD
jgi:hypothetical protein